MQRADQACVPGGGEGTGSHSPAIRRTRSATPTAIEIFLGKISIGSLTDWSIRFSCARVLLTAPIPDGVQLAVDPRPCAAPRSVLPNTPN